MSELVLGLTLLLCYLHFYPAENTVSNVFDRVVEQVGENWYLDGISRRQMGG